MLPVLLSAALVGPPAPDRRQAAPVQTPTSSGEAWAACAAVAADLGTTEWALSRGHEEGNPLVRSRALRVGLGGAQCVGLHVLTSKSPKAGRLASRITILVRTGVAAYNVVRGWRK
jgi:hypothetical protein